MLRGLRDFAFRSAPGQWTLWRCGACRCGYLDPRPTPDSIGRAYSNYYTHATRSRSRSFIGSIRAKAKSSVLSLAAHTQRGWAGAAIARTPGLSARYHRLRQRIRHTPPPSRPGARLLDGGCGDGAFLETAAALGFVAIGTDVDPQAVKAARSRGFDVRCCALPGSDLEPESFEHVTLNSVVEHLHDPVRALREVYALLEPGGRLWLTQPNLGALGLAEFGIYWRGLEPPRHLTLWDPASLTALLQRCGFERVTSLPTNPDAAPFYFRQSYLQRLGLDPYRDRRELGPTLQRQLAEAMRESRRHAALGESLTMVCYRPR